MCLFIGNTVEMDGWCRHSAVWYIQHTTSKVNLYQCPHGTDTPPIDDWGVTVYGEGQPPRIKCLKPPTHNHLFLHLALEELVAIDKYVSHLPLLVSFCAKPAGGRHISGSI
jgi:hypothetical protein